jgi:hypothetical protein
MTKRPFRVSATDLQESNARRCGGRIRHVHGRFCGQLSNRDVLTEKVTQKFQAALGWRALCPHGLVGDKSSLNRRLRCEGYGTFKHVIEHRGGVKQIAN